MFPFNGQKQESVSDPMMPAAKEAPVAAAPQSVTHRVLYYRASDRHAWHPLKSLEKGDPDEAVIFAALRTEKIREAIAAGAVTPDFAVSTEQNGVSV